MKIVISGIGGFLGSHLARFFSNGNDLVGISTSECKIDNAAVFNFDNLDVISNPDVVIHCHAAVASGTNVLDAETLYAGNIAATRRIADQFPQARHIYISSVSVYGNNTELITEHTPANPQTDYAKSKFDAEQIIENLPNTVIIRLSSLYGNGMKENTLIPNYVNQALRKGQIEVWGSGARRQNYFHIDDVAALIASVITKDQWVHPIFLGVSTVEYSNLQIAQMIASETQAEIIHTNNDNALSVQYNNTFTQNTLNWHPQTDTIDAIKAYIQWKKRQY